MIDVTSVKTMRESDAAAIAAGTPAAVLMARAGKAIFEAVNWKPPVAIVCGVGNNAGDGFAVATLMARGGIDCTIFMLSDRVSEVSRPFLEEAVSLSVEIRRGMTANALDGFATVLDCIFGTGFHGDLAEPYLSAIEAINKSSAYVVSADINSGLDGDSGLCDVCVRSDLTVSVGTFKSGLFLGGGKDVMADRLNCDIGIGLTDAPARLIEASDIDHIFKKRPHFSNKGDYGYVALIGGSVEYSGAAKLANLSLAALRSGAGVSKLAVPDCIADAVLPYLLESTLFPLESAGGRYVYNADTLGRIISGTSCVAVGMGIGRSADVKLLISHLLSSYSGNLVIDADGLNALSELGGDILKSSSANVILTPHPKEFERLSGVKVSEILSDPISHAVRYAKAHGVILLLKGSSTVVTDGSVVYIIDRGTPGMATAGSGDVLSGILAGIGGYSDSASLPLAVAAAAFIAGFAAELAVREIPPASMVARDTVAALPLAIRSVIDAV